MVVTFDGQSGTGKSTLATLVADALNFKCLNTGMIYRALTHYFYTNNILPTDIKKIEQELNNIDIEILFKDSKQFVKINSIDCTPFVSSQIVQQNVSLYSQIVMLRQKVNIIQHSFAEKNNIVVEGRDIGSYVFPNAEYKFFVTCDIKIRAERRLKDLKASGQDITLEQVIQSLKTRDVIDSTREYSPLKRPDDAIDIDTSNQTIQQSVEQILAHIKK